MPEPSMSDVTWAVRELVESWHLLMFSASPTPEYD